MRHFHDFAKVDLINGSKRKDRILKNNEDTFSNLEKESEFYKIKK